MGKNTKYIEVDQLNLNATKDRTVASSFNTLGHGFEPKLSCMDKKERWKELWAMAFTFAVVVGPMIFYLIF